MGTGNPIADHRETRYGISLTIKKPTARYIDEFLALKAAPDLIQAKLFPNAKEITESMAAFHAVRKRWSQFPTDDPDIMLVAVGDGNTPRTAALFAYRTSWKCYSIDPRLKKGSGNGIDRLEVFPYKIEDFVWTRQGVIHYETKAIIYVLVHAHVGTKWFKPDLHPDKTLIVGMPCCVPYETPKGCVEIAKYADWGCWSPHRELTTWKLRREAPEQELAAAVSEVKQPADEVHDDAFGYGGENIPPI